MLQEIEMILMMKLLDTSLPPVISLVGSSTIYLGVGDTFTDAGATAEDSIDGDITSSITSSGTVDTATEGTYSIDVLSL